MFYKIYFSEEESIRFHEIGFLKKYGTIYDLLDNVLTSKITTNNANVDQINFVVNLMYRYKEDDLFDEETEISVKRYILEKQTFKKCK